MAKTPISILQELGMKDGYLPVYTWVSEQAVGNINVFKFQVKYKGIVAIGKALNKKKAKHNAAENMIALMEDLRNNINTKQILPLKEDIPETEQISSMKDICLKLDSLNINSKIKDITNYVGKLQEYCSLNSLIMPEYVINNISGEPHQQSFTMACKLGAIVEEATSTTKKQAKQLAAKQLLDRLGNSNALILVERSDKKTEDDSIQKEDDDILTKSGVRILKLNCNMSEEDVKDKYRELTKNNCIKNNLLDRSHNINNYHNHIKYVILSKICKDDKLDTIYCNINNFKESLSKITNDNGNGIEELPFHHILQYVKETLKFDIEKRILPCNDRLLKAVAYKITTPVPVTQFGINRNIQVAEAFALHNILDTIMIYLK